MLQAGALDAAVAASTDGSDGETIDRSLGGATLPQHTTLALVNRTAIEQCRGPLTGLRLPRELSMSIHWMTYANIHDQSEKLQRFIFKKIST